MENINIYWDEFCELEELTKKVKGNNEDTDYGVYQIYGSHPIYGNDVLLYIGKAIQQTFATRINQEKHWWYNKDSSNVKIYLGRLIGNRPLDTAQWDEMISKAEEILIYSHKPAHNSSNINSVNEKRLSNTHVLNWGNYRSLLAEVSSMRLFDETKEDNENFFSMNQDN